LRTYFKIIFKKYILRHHLQLQLLLYKTVDPTAIPKRRHLGWHPTLFKETIMIYHHLVVFKQHDPIELRESSLV